MIIDFRNSAINGGGSGGGAFTLPLIPVDVLPTASAETMNKIYLLAKEGSGTDVKDEYITYTDTEGGETVYLWEKIGDTSVDLSGYYTKSETDTLLSAKQTTANLVTSLSAQSTDTQYPSAKCVYDKINELDVNKLGAVSSFPANANEGDTIALKEEQSYENGITVEDMLFENDTLAGKRFIIPVGCTDDLGEGEAFYVGKAGPESGNNQGLLDIYLTSDGNGGTYFYYGYRPSEPSESNLIILLSLTDGEEMDNYANDVCFNYHNDVDSYIVDIYPDSLADVVSPVVFEDIQDGVIIGVYQYNGSTWNKLEEAANKVTSLSAQSTDNQYPSAKCVYDAIQAAPGGGGNEVILTQAQYDALSAPDANTTYIISDAPVVDISNYCLVSSYNNLAAEVATKAASANISAGSAITGLPSWNSDGIITGIGSTWYTRSMYINGSGLMWMDRNYSAGSMGSFYAPTTTGTAGQMLLSSGGNTPAWTSQKIVFITRSEYEAMSSHDANTLYILTA